MGCFCMRAKMRPVLNRPMLLRNMYNQHPRPAHPICRTTYALLLLTCSCSCSCNGSCCSPVPDTQLRRQPLEKHTACMLRNTRSALRRQRHSLAVAAGTLPCGVVSQTPAQHPGGRLLCPQQPENRGRKA